MPITVDPKAKFVAPSKAAKAKAEVVPEKFRGKSYRILHTLGEERLAKIDRYFREGWSPRRLTVLLHGTWGVLLDEAPFGLEMKLHAYRRDTLWKEKARATLSIEQTLTPKQLAATVSRFDVLEEMTKLAKNQKTRTDRALHRENQLGDAGIALGYVTENVKVYQSLLRDLADLYLEVGLLKRAPKATLNMPAEPAGDEGPANGDAVVFYQWTDETEAAAALIEQFRSVG